MSIWEGSSVGRLKFNGVWQPFTFMRKDLGQYLFWYKVTLCLLQGVTLIKMQLSVGESSLSRVKWGKAKVDLRFSE